MASKRFEKGSDEFMMFQDFWKLCQQFWVVEDDEKYWEEVIKETDSFYKKYQHEIFAKEIVLAFIRSLEEKNKQRRADLDSKRAPN